jgi:single-stranded DNA-binding protein
MSTQNTVQVTLTGNLGGDPETKTLTGQTVSRSTFDPSLDVVVTEVFTKSDREIRVASLAINYHAEGRDQTRWIRLVDFQDHLAPYGKGDCLSVLGYFRTRQYLKDGETKEIREFVVTFSRAIFLKDREDAA